MVTKNITLPTITDVKEFVNVMLECPVDADLISGRFKVDAKSIMGIFSLDLSEVVTLQFHTEDGQEIVSTLRRIEKFMLK